MSNNPSTLARGNIAQHWLSSITLTPASVAANTSAEQTFTVDGLHLGDFVSVDKPSAQAGLIIGGTRVSAANTLAITFGNLTGSPITPTAAEVYVLLTARADNLNSSGTPLRTTA